MNIVILQHQSAGAIFLVEEGLFKLSDQEIGDIVLKKVKQDFPQLIAHLNLEAFEQVIITHQPARNRMILAIIGDEGLVPFTAELRPVFQLVEGTLVTEEVEESRLINAF